MKLVPLGDKIVLKQLEAEETTKSGIVLPGQAKEKPQEAEVIAVGPGGVVDGKEVVGFIPLEYKKREAVINNYYIRNNNAEVLKALLEKVIAKMDKDKYLSSVTFVEHQEIFKELGFSVEKEWKRYVKMNKEN